MFRYRYDTETGLYYLQSRYYNPEWGRFINADAISAVSGELLSTNMFAYCINNPINMKDPNGFLSFSASDDASSSFSLTWWIENKVEEFISDNSPAYNWVEAAIGRELVTGKTLIQSEQDAKVHNGFEVLESGLIVGSVGTSSGFGKKAIIKANELPTMGKIRYIPPKKWTPTQRLPMKGNGFIDKFGNVWVPGESRTAGQAFEWDVQLSRTGRSQLGQFTRDGSHLNVSLDGRITHK